MFNYYNDIYNKRINQMEKPKNISEELNRIKSLFTEERLYGNIVTESVSEFEEKVSKLDDDEKDILRDILGEDDMVSEGFDEFLEKVKKYAKKGLLTIGIITALLASPNITQAQSVQLRNITQTETSVKSPNKYDLNTMTNTQVFKIVTMLIKTNPKESSEWVKVNDKNGDMLYLLVANIESGKDMSKNADYYGGRLKTQKTQDFVNAMTGTGSTGTAHVGGFGN